MSDPIGVGHPNHYSLVRFIGTDIDSGGIHINSGVPNQAYYLAVAGGTNRVSGCAVQGVGLANRERMERIFYRGFVYYLGMVDVPRRAGRDDSGRHGTVRQHQRRDEGRDGRLGGGRGLLMRGRRPWIALVGAVAFAAGDAALAQTRREPTRGYAGVSVGALVTSSTVSAPLTFPVYRRDGTGRDRGFVAGRSHRRIRRRRAAVA